jgi:hypothetical protein
MSVNTNLTFSTTQVSNPLIFGGVTYNSLNSPTNTLYRNTEGITSIASSAFVGAINLISIQIPSTVLTIGESAFSAVTTLQTVIFDSNTLTTIDIGAFDNCTSMTTFAIPTSVTTIGSYAFNTCSSMVSFTVPSGITFIDDNIFENCTSMTTCNLPSTLDTIKYGVFAGCSSLTSITLPSSLTTILDFAFINSGLTTCTVPNSVTTIGTQAFDTATLQWFENSSTTLSLPANSSVFNSAFNDNSKTLFTANSSTQMYSYITTYFPSTTIVLGPSCYDESTFLLTKDGYKQINTITTNDYIKTLNDGYKKVIKIHFQPFSANDSTPFTAMYKIDMNNEFGTIMLTGGHGIFFEEYNPCMQSFTTNKDEWFIDGMHLTLVGLMTDSVKLENKRYNVYHVVLENDDATRRYAVYANGLLSETMSEKYFDDIRTRR